MNLQSTLVSCRSPQTEFPVTFSWIFQPRRQSFSDFIATELNWRNDAIYLLQGFWKAVEYRKTKQLGIAHEQSVIASVESSFEVYVVKTVWSLLHLSDNMTFLAFYQIFVVFFIPDLPWPFKLPWLFQFSITCIVGVPVILCIFNVVILLLTLSLIFVICLFF